MFDLCAPDIPERQCGGLNVCTGGKRAKEFLKCVGICAPDIPERRGGLNVCTGGKRTKEFLKCVGICAPDVPERQCGGLNVCTGGKKGQGVSETCWTYMLLTFLKDDMVVSMYRRKNDLEVFPP